MRRLAFVIAVLGMFVLALMLDLNVKEISEYDDLLELEINQQVRLSGLVVGEKRIIDGKLLELDNNISLVCSCFGDFLGSEVFVEGIVEEYGGKKEVEVLRLEVLSD